MTRLTRQTLDKNKPVAGANRRAGLKRSHGRTNRKRYGRHGAGRLSSQSVKICGCSKQTTSTLMLRRLETAERTESLTTLRGANVMRDLTLSSGGDLTTPLRWKFRLLKDGRQKYYLWSHSFMPRARLAGTYKIRSCALRYLGKRKVDNRYGWRE